MKKVAIYGFAPQTRGFVEQSTADEVWSLNNCYAYGLPVERIGRTFEMHELWLALFNAQRSDDGKKYLKWLMDPHPFPMYMHMVKEDFVKVLDEFEAIDLDELMDKRDNIDDETNDSKLDRLKTWIESQKKTAEVSIDFFNKTKATILKYPLDEVWDDICPVLPDINLEVFPERGMKKYFTSTMDYMAALAIHESKPGDQIEFYGIELKEKTEWALQKPSMEFWIGIAKGRGIRMLIPQNSYLINAPLYGLGDAQMIAVQIPEQLRRKYMEKMDYNRNLFNHMAGQFTAKMEAGADDKSAEMMELGAKIDKAKYMIGMYEGAANAMTHMIENENMDIEGLEIHTVTKFEVLEH